MVEWDCFRLVTAVGSHLFIMATTPDPVVHVPVQSDLDEATTCL